MGLSQEFMMASAMTDDPTKLVVAIPAAIAGVTAAAKAFTIVHQSEMGVRMRRGAPMLKPEILDGIMADIETDVPDIRLWQARQSALEQMYPFERAPEVEVSTGRLLLPVHNLPKSDIKDKAELKKRIDEKIEDLPPEVRDQGIYQVVGRGIVWLVPFIDQVVRINVASQTTPLDNFPLDTLDGPQVDVIPGITWNVRSNGDNPYKALFAVNNEKDDQIKNKTRELEQTVAWICSGGLSRVLRDRPYDEVRNFDPKEITARIQELCGQDLLRFGVHLSDVWLKFPAYTPAERLAQAIEGRGDRDPQDAAALIAAAVSTGTDGKGTVLSIVPDQPA